MTVSFFVPGNPVAQGSMKAVRNHATGQAMLTSTSGQNLKHWRDAIGLTARQQVTDIIDEGPVCLSLWFLVSRPKSAPKKRTHPSVKPDIDKLTRAALDALSGIAYRDDAQVVSLHVGKRYCQEDEQPGVQVVLRKESGTEVPA